MSIFDAIWQGLIQGLTEFLPVSSSGHLSIFQYFTGLSSDESTVFAVMLHFGTLIAVFAAFYKTIWELVREFFLMVGDIFKGRFSLKTDRPLRRMIFMLILSLLPLLAVVLVNDKISGIMGDNDILIEGFAFLFTSFLLFLSDRVVKGRVTADSMTPQMAVAIGVAQCVATVPGVSRSGSTICTGLLCRLDRSYAVTYSFILGVPAVLGAGILEFKDIPAEGFGISPLVVAVGMLVAAVSGFCAIRLVQYLVVKDKMKVFAVYTLALGLLVVGAGFVEHLTGGVIRQFIAAL